MRISFKVKVTRPITADTESVSYQLPNGYAYELQNWYADALSTATASYKGL